MEVDLQPRQPEVVERAAEPHEPLAAHGEVQVEHEVHAGTRALAQRLELRARRGDDVVPRPPRVLEAGREAGVGQLGPVRPVEHRVRLRRRVAPLAHLAAERHPALDAVEGRGAEQVAARRAERSAVRPVRPDPVADRAAEQRVGREARRLAREVDARVLDRRDGLRHQAAGADPRHRPQVTGQPRERLGIAAEDVRRQRLDDAGEPGAPRRLEVLRPADEAGVGLQPEVGDRPPAPVGVHGPETGDSHRTRLDG